MRDFLLEMLTVKSDYRCEELQDMLANKYGIWVSERTLHRLLRSESFTDKLLSRTASQRDVDPAIRTMGPTATQDVLAPQNRSDVGALHGIQHDNRTR